jgi:hypothetical protein
MIVFRNTVNSAFHCILMSTFGGIAKPILRWHGGRAIARARRTILQGDVSARHRVGIKPHASMTMKEQAKLAEKLHARACALHGREARREDFCWYHHNGELYVLDIVTGRRLPYLNPAAFHVVVYRKSGGWGVKVERLKTGWRGYD